MYIKEKNSHNNNKGCGKMEIVQKIALSITIIGAINWGLIGLFDFNLVHMLFENIEILEKITYILVGIAGLINIGALFMDFKED